MMRMRTIADVIARFRANWRGYLREYRVLLILLGVAALADMLSTIYFMLVDGPAAERHPAIRAVSIILGPVLGPIVGKLCQIATVIVVTVYLRRLALYSRGRHHPLRLGGLVQHCCHARPARQPMMQWLPPAWRCAPGRRKVSPISERSRRL
jgi:hypothetical protein